MIDKTKPLYTMNWWIVNGKIRGAGITGMKNEVRILSTSELSTLESLTEQLLKNVLVNNKASVCYSVQIYAGAKPQ